MDNLFPLSLLQPYFISLVTFVAFNVVLLFVYAASVTAAALLVAKVIL